MYDHDQRAYRDPLWRKDATIGRPMKLRAQKSGFRSASVASYVVPTQPRTWVLHLERAWPQTSSRTSAAGRRTAGQQCRQRTEATS